MVYASRLRLPLGTLLHFASLSAWYALVPCFCSSGHDFTIASSRPSVATWTLQVALGFVGNYAPRRLSPQMYNMPVIQIKQLANRWLLFCCCCASGYTNCLNHSLNRGRLSRDYHTFAGGLWSVHRNNFVSLGRQICRGIDCAQYRPFLIWCKNFRIQV